jgi:3-oxoacyl-[acyl-carrier-protein] synthase I
VRTVNAAPAKPVSHIAARSLVSATGVGLASFAQALRHNRSALAANTFTREALPTWVGQVSELPTALPSAWREWDCRANRLAWLGLLADDFISQAQAACQHWGASRIGLVLGTSASTIGASELAYRTLDADGGFPAALRSERLNTLHAVAAFVQHALGLQGPCITVSTACSSSAKAFAQADRWLHLGLVDAVVVAGVDALCDSLLYGFAALQLVAPDACAPFSAQRRGISVGEAAGFVLLQRGPGALQLLGYGEANDAHHMSAPHPQGLGAEAALDAALRQASLHAHDIDHVQLHGTGTAHNDAVEAALIARRYSASVHASACKGITGHTMGAAGIVAALAALQALQDGCCAGTVGTAAIDPELAAPFAQQLRLLPAQRPVKHAASHAFGFGGNNAVLIFAAGGT